MPASKERSKKKGAYAFKEGELDRDSVYAKNAYTASDGKIYREGMKRRRSLSFNGFVATSFAEATVVKKNAKGAKELGGGVYTPYTAK